MKWINTAGEKVWGGVFMCFSVRCGRFWRQQQSSLQLESVVEACDHRQHLSEVQNPEELRGTSSHGGTEWEQPQPAVTRRKASSAPPKRCTCSTPAAHICFNSFRILTCAEPNRARLLCTFNAFRFQRRVLVWFFELWEPFKRVFSPVNPSAAATRTHFQNKYTDTDIGSCSLADIHLLFKALLIIEPTVVKGFNMFRMMAQFLWLPKKVKAFYISPLNESPPWGNGVIFLDMVHPILLDVLT